MILREDLSKEVEKVYEFDIERMAVVEDNVSIFVGAAPEYSAREMVRVFRSKTVPRRCLKKFLR